MGMQGRRPTRGQTGCTTKEAVHLQKGMKNQGKGEKRKRQFLRRGGKWKDEVVRPYLKNKANKKKNRIVEEGVSSRTRAKGCEMGLQP